jgi:hypothetical protein
MLAFSHFTAALLFSVFASVVFGITQREGAREQAVYGLKCFGMFVGGLIAGGWLMWLVRR